MLQFIILLVNITSPMITSLIQISLLLPLLLAAPLDQISSPAAESPAPGTAAAAPSAGSQIAAAIAGEISPPSEPAALPVEPVAVAAASAASESTAALSDSTLAAVAVEESTLAQTVAPTLDLLRSYSPEVTHNVCRSLTRTEMDLIKSIPNEIWQRIFSNLTIPEIQTASLVCR